MVDGHGGRDKKDLIAVLHLVFISVVPAINVKSLRIDCEDWEKSSAVAVRHHRFIRIGEERRGEERTGEYQFQFNF